MSKIFCDSGAFSAYRNKTKINIQEYIDFIKEHKDLIETYANLDDIGSPIQTWINQSIMEKQGLTPIPVYHMGESEEYFNRCLEYDYFAVGGIASKLTAPGALKRHLDKLFLKVCPEKNNYYPTHKVHGFGITTPSLLIRYPWYSADSTSWVLYGKFGIILIPRFQNGKFHYDKAPLTLEISFRSKAVGEKDHYNNLSEMDKEWIYDYCLNKGFKIGKAELIDVPVGYELQENENWFDKKKKNKVERIIEKGLCCNGEMRDKINLEYFLDLEKYQPKWPWPFNVVQPLFD